MKHAQKISQHDVTAAMAKFLASGGIVNKLPDQNYKPSRMVGEEKYAIYEPLNMLQSLTNPEHGSPDRSAH